MDGIKRVRAGKARVVHVETALGIVNVYLGLHDDKGRRVETVEIIPTAAVGGLRIERRGRRLVELKTRRVGAL